MPPSEDRRYRRALPVTLVAGLVLGLVVSRYDLAVGWIYLGFAAVMGTMALYVLYQRPGEEEERRQFARKRGLTYPSPRRGFLRR